MLKFVSCLYCSHGKNNRVAWIILGGILSSLLFWNKNNSWLGRNDVDGIAPRLVQWAVGREVRGLAEPLHYVPGKRNFTLNVHFYTKE